MKTESEVLQIIANQLQAVIDKAGFGKDYHWIICTERIFLDDYKPKVDDYIKRLNVPKDTEDTYDLDSLQDGYETPDEMPYQHTIFVILNMGEGQINFAVWNCPVSMKILSEENTFDVSREMMTLFMADVNFKFKDEIIQSYFTPEVSEPFSEMYAGFRGIMLCRGFVRVPEPNIMFATNVLIDMGNGWENYPFINIAFDHAAQPDPQPFPEYHGATMSLNRMTTQAVSVTSYLWKNSGSASINAFCKAVMKAMNDMNKKFKLAVLSNIEADSNDEDYDEAIQEPNGEKRYYPIMASYFVLTNAHYTQDWGDLNPWVLTFSRAKETEG